MDTCSHLNLMGVQQLPLLCLSHEKVFTHFTPLKWWFVTDKLKAFTYKPKSLRFYLIFVVFFRLLSLSLSFSLFQCCWLLNMQQ